MTTRAPSYPDPQAAAPRWRGWRAEALRIGLLLLLLLVFRSSFANHYVVPTGSMQPNLQPGDRVLVDMRAYGWRLPLAGTLLAGSGQPRAGDVAVFASPHDGVRLIKRIVALPGDRVAVRDGHLWINGQPAAIPGDASLERIGGRMVRLELADGGGPDMFETVVPTGQALVVGDHRGDSFDGRMFGYVPLSAFYARAVAVYWRRGEGPGWHRLGAGSAQ